MRRRSWVTVLLGFFTVSLLLSQLSSASTTFRVNEAKTRLLLEDKVTNLSLATENPTGRSFPAHVRLEVLDPEGHSVAVTESDETIKRGNVALVIPLPLQLERLSGHDRDEILWYRLHYTVTPLSATDISSERVEGIVALSEITPDFFQLNVTAPENAREGTRYRAQVRTNHPITLRPVRDIQVEAKLEFDGSNDIEDIMVSGVTNSNGYVVFDFDLPRKIQDEDDLDLKIVARRGVLVEEVDTEIDIDREAQILISTDKPLYQPGQVLHARTLMFDSQKRAVGERDVTIEIRDPEYKIIFSTELKTTRFGVASADWPIPDNIRLGDYTIHVEVENGDDESMASAVVKVSRYEIPNFAVQVKPDLPYYLPGQQASIEVRADYLFGKPVKRGHVRVVRETARHWNYSEQKWDSKEEEKYEGETNEQGVFVVHPDLSKEHNELQREDYSRFRDLSYAAYFTDPTTNRTEQRRFDLRLTKSPIHVYLIESGLRQTRNFPLQFYVSTYYADGAPAQCEVKISENVVHSSLDKSSISSYEEPLRTVKTNRYGVAKVADLVLPKQDPGEDEATLTFLAHDGKGASARQASTVDLQERPVIRLETNKTLYGPGEPIRVNLESSDPDMKVVMDVWNGPVALQSRVVQLHKGSASLTVPYDKAFKDKVTITAYSYNATAGESRYDIPSVFRQVLFPRERDLRLDVRLDQSTYKPGEDAHAKFTVLNAEGRSIESALGVVVFDKAIEERARTDREFGARYGFYDAYRSLNGYDNEMSGLTESDFDKLDLSKPIPEEMELVAEIMTGSGSYLPNIFASREYSMDQREIFSKLIARQVKPMEDALKAHYAERMEYPKDEATLRRLLDMTKLDYALQRDPWGTPFRASFNVERDLDELRIASAGADKRFDTADDFIATRLFWPYFRPLGETLNRTVEQYHKTTRGYLRDAATVQRELLGGGTDFNAWRDPWGKPYALEFGTSGTNFTVVVKSGGPNGKFETTGAASVDDFTVWTTFADYFAEKRTEIGSALAEHLRRTGRFPQNETEVLAYLEKLNLGALRDPWGQSYYVAFSNDPRYAFGFNVRTYSVYDDEAKKVRKISPSTQPITLIRFRSPGADGKQGTADDFDVAALSRQEIEMISKGLQPLQTGTAVVIAGTSGAIVGTITDPQDAVVPGATVKATNASTSVVYETWSDDEGRFTLGNLPSGLYTVLIESPGFMAYVLERVPVRSSNITRVDNRLEVGAVAAAVNITDSAGAQLNQTSSTVGKRIEINFLLDGVNNNNRAQVSTPRLREYFPETLVWQPLLETDSQGRAQIDFKLADNITTWKLAVIGSTVDGEVGVVEKDIRAFQPFFVEHDPPRVLTEGDEIQLPVVLRNYLDKPQAVDLEIKPESWFALSSAGRKRAEVASGESSRETFDFRAIASVTDGKQRITATGPGASDAIEKPVSVHPDGEERAETISRILGDTTTIDLNLPVELIKGSLRAEVKIYPNLMSHVAESVEGILVRPYGCGEQTISSTYPNLMILRFNKSIGLDSSVTARARHYLEEGYKRLLNYRAESGGIAYWGGQEANFALTAYGLRFLNDARDYIAVDDAVLNGARDYLIKQQQPDGSWNVYPRYGTSPDTVHQNALTTSYIARTLAAVEAKNGGKSEASTKSSEQSATSASLRRALEYLARRINGMSDPYTLASYALAAIDAGDSTSAGLAITKLRALAHAENAGTFSWEGTLGTPFYGWGTAGRIETTALVLQALKRYCALTNADCVSKEGDSSNPQSEIRIPQLMDGALLYLLRQKDRYGVWHSTQATVNVLDAIVAVFSKAGSDTESHAELSVNGRPAISMNIPAGRLNNPVTADISQFVSPGENQIVIRRAGGAHYVASAQVVSTYYIPWSVAQAAHSANQSQSPLRLAVAFSKSQAAINEEVTCKVDVAGKNYGGMLLAEIGLPPGSDVDRASLELAVKNSNWGLSRYDVLPDRVVVYLWPRAGGTNFEFKFRPRFGLNAQSASSVLYDYYNPEARAVVAPTKFVVR